MWWLLSAQGWHVYSPRHSSGVHTLLGALLAPPREASLGSGCSLGEADGGDSGWHSQGLCIPPVPLLPRRCFMSRNSQGCSTSAGRTGGCGWSSRLTRGPGCVTHPVVGSPEHRASSLWIVAVAARHVLINSSSRASSAGKWEATVLGQSSLSSAVARASRGRALSPALGGVTQNAQCGLTLSSPQRALPRALVYF